MALVPASITLNTPLRSRSARMMAETCCRRHAFVGEGGHRDRDLVAAHAGNFDAHLGAVRPRPSAGWRSKQ